MAKTLEMVFETQDGKSSTISIENPKEPVDVSQLKMAMQQMIVANAFTSASGDLISVKGARLVERNVEEVDVI